MDLVQADCATVDAVPCNHVRPAWHRTLVSWCRAADDSSAGGRCRGFTAWPRAFAGAHSGRVVWGIRCPGVRAGLSRDDALSVPLLHKFWRTKSCSALNGDPNCGHLYKWFQYEGPRPANVIAGLLARFCA